MGRKSRRLSQDLVYRVRLDDKDISVILVALKHYRRCEYAYRDPELSERLDFLIRKFSQIRKWSEIHCARYTARIMKESKKVFK